VAIVHHKQKYIGTAAKGFIEILINYINGNRELEESGIDKVLSRLL
jgi:hypothetical protein